MTEKQAKTKWCPMVRVGVMPGAGGPAGINDPETNFSGNCIGSGCALWQWGHQVRRRVILPNQETAAVEPPKPAHVPASWTFSPYEPYDGEPSQWVQPEDEARLETNGYCGLVLRPGVLA